MKPSRPLRMNDIPIKLEKYIKGLMIKNLILFFLVFYLFGCEEITNSGSASSTDNLPTQGWTLTNDAGDVAYVLVKPFINSGTFTEQSNSPGWWLYDSGGNRVAKIPMNGTVSHAGQYDRWSFTITVQGGGMRITGTGEGQTTDGIYPNARNIKGTTTGTATSPMGSQHVSGTWTGNDYTIWH
jgi:hypothetical protein